MHPTTLWDLPTISAKSNFLIYSRNKLTVIGKTPNHQGQGNQVVLEPQVQVTTIWRPRTFKPQPYSSTTRILFARRGLHTTLPRSFSTVDLPMLKSNHIYVSIQSPFFADFVTGMMGDISLLMGSNGEDQEELQKGLITN